MPVTLSQNRLFSPADRLLEEEGLPYQVTYEGYTFPEPGEWFLYYCGPHAERRVILQGVEGTEVWHDEDDLSAYPVYAMLVFAAFEIEPGLGILRQYRRELIFEPEFREHLDLLHRIDLIQRNTKHDVEGRDFISDNLAEEVSVRRYDQPFYIFGAEVGERLLRPCIV